MKFASAAFRVFLFAIFFAGPLFAQTLEIKLVNGRNGHPMIGASSYINIWVGKARKGAIATATDADGIARIQLTTDVNAVNLPNADVPGSTEIQHPVMKYDSFFQVRVPYVVCVPNGSDYSWLGLVDFSTKEIIEHGYVSANACGTVAVSRQPGQVVLFVRPLTFWEKLKQ